MTVRLIILLIFLPLHFLAGQPIIRSGALPVPGDTIYFLTDELPGEIKLEPEGEPHFWNFLGLRAPYIEYYLVETAASGKYYKEFPKADIYLQDRNGFQTYFSIEDNRVLLHGGSGWELFEETMVPAIFSYDPPLIVRAIPVELGQSVRDVSQLRIVAAMKDLPSDKLNFLPYIPDSLQITGTISRQIEVDNWGNLAIPGGEYSVLRQKISDEQRFTTWLKQGNGSWNAVQDRMPNNFPHPARSIQYEFMSEEDRFPLVSVAANLENVPLWIKYWARKELRDLYRPFDAGQLIYAYPNHAISKVRIKFSKIQPGNYVIRFYNILGKPILERRYSLSGTRTIEIDIGRLEKGTYLYSLIDANNNKIITKRLIILKP